MNKLVKKEAGKDDKIIELLEEILKWTKFGGMLKVKDVLLDTLKKDEEKLAYQFSDGRSSREVAKTAGMHFTTVLGYWKRWSAVGIVEPLRVRRGLRYKRVFSLEDLGIEVPTPKKTEKEGNMDE